MKVTFFEQITAKDQKCAEPNDSSAGRRQSVTAVNAVNVCSFRSYFGFCIITSKFECVCCMNTRSLSEF